MGDEIVRPLRLSGGLPLCVRRFLGAGPWDVPGFQSADTPWELGSSTSSRSNSDVPNGSAIWLLPAAVECTRTCCGTFVFSACLQQRKFLRQVPSLTETVTLPCGAGIGEHQPPTGDRQQIATTEEALAVLAEELGATEDAPPLALALREDTQ